MATGDRGGNVREAWGSLSVVLEALEGNGDVDVDAADAVKATWNARRRP